MVRLGFREWIAAGRAIAAHDVLRVSGKHQFCARFENDFAEMLDANHALLVNSGTSALICALAAAGVGPGDEVIVPAYTWMASAAAPLLVGAVPILADIDETLTIDPVDVASKITPRTRAILPVHMINRPCAMNRLLALAKQHDLLVIEDACQAVGVRYRDAYCGTIGDAGAFSFNQYKNMSIGEGGAVVTNSDAVIARAWNYHDAGISFREANVPNSDLPAFVGTNMRATEIEGAMLRVQLEKLKGRLKRMDRRHQILHDALMKAGLPVAPHNDPNTAIGLAVTFDTEAEAMTFADRRGVSRLLDNSKHVYTNWDPVLHKRMFHSRMDPWSWLNENIEYSQDMCTKTLDVLGRSCRVSLLEDYPLPVVKWFASKLASASS